jgi:alpha-ketoglutarate-dependent taurine dioxygenase
MNHSLQSNVRNNATRPPQSIGHATNTKVGRGMAGGAVAFSCQSQEEFLNNFAQIARHVGLHGYVIIEAWDIEPATLTAIAKRFGHVQSHIRADANGLVGIAIDTVVNHEWEKFRSEYHGVNAEEFLPHTDGSYLHGLVHKDGKYIQLLPPGMLILQSVRAASAGGANLLIDGQRVFADLRARQPHFAEILSQKGCITYCRDDQIALDCAVFEKQQDGNVALRFRYDSTAYVAEWAAEAFHALQNEYWADPEYQMLITLRPGQILAIDNTRMLHGREAFVAGTDGNKERSLRRIWLAREHLPVLRNAVDEHIARRALKPFEAYNVNSAVDGEVGDPGLLLGIRPTVAVHHSA